jgi:tryptophan-rich sensory protein
MIYKVRKFTFFNTPLKARCVPRSEIETKNYQRFEKPFMTKYEAAFMAVWIQSVFFANALAAPPQITGTGPPP